MERKLKLKKSAIIFGQSLSIFLKYLKRRPMLFCFLDIEYIKDTEIYLMRLMKAIYQLSRKSRLRLKL